MASGLSVAGPGGPELLCLPGSGGPGAEPPAAHLADRLSWVVKAGKADYINNIEDVGSICKNSKGNHGNNILN